MTTNEQAGGERSTQEIDTKGRDKVFLIIKEPDLDLSQFEGMTRIKDVVCEFHGGLPDDDALEGVEQIIAEVKRLREENAGLKRNRCDHCGAATTGPCPDCGAPQCCPKCCAIDRLATERDSLRADVERLTGERDFWKRRHEEARACNSANASSVESFESKCDSLTRERDRLDMLGQRSIELVGRLFGIDGVHILGAADNDEDCSMEVAIKILHKRAEEARDRIAKLERYGERHRAVVESLVKWDEQGDEAGATRALVQLDNICNEARAAMQTNPER